MRTLSNLFLHTCKNAYALFAYVCMCVCVARVRDVWISQTALRDQVSCVGCLCLCRCLFLSACVCPSAICVWVLGGLIYNLFSNMRLKP
jgi:hypothetical protein